VAFTGHDRGYDVLDGNHEAGKTMQKPLAMRKVHDASHRLRPSVCRRGGAGETIITSNHVYAEHNLKGQANDNHKQWMAGISCQQWPNRVRLSKKTWQYLARGHSHLQRSDSERKKEH